MRVWGIIGVLLCTSCAFATPFTFTTMPVERGAFLPPQAEGNGWAFGRAGMVPAWSVLCNFLMACDGGSSIGTGGNGMGLPAVPNQPSTSGQVNGNQVAQSGDTTANVGSFIAPVSNNANANAGGNVVTPGNAGNAPGIVNNPGLGGEMGNGNPGGPIRSGVEATETPEPATFGMFALAGGLLIFGRRAFRTAGTRR